MAPTRRTILLVGLGAPIALVIGLFGPSFWLAAPAWVALCLAAFAFDLVMAPPISAARLSLAAPASIGVGEPMTLDAVVETGGRGRPRDARLALAVDGRLAPSGRIDTLLRVRDDGTIGAKLGLQAIRRGMARIARGWVQWQGPLGLARMQRSIALDLDLAVVPSIRAVREQGASLFSRDAMVGQRLNARVGEGSEFESLVRFTPGFDRRTIDWKQSARHTELLAKQFEIERDNRIVIAIDSGRMMSEPIVDARGTSEPRLDWAMTAALTLSYVALRMEDRVSFGSFAGRPRVSAREYNRISDFVALRRAAADVDYSLDETNYTLGLATIAAQLKRRAMIVIFTEFADATSAELMLRATERLVKKHLVLFVVTADSELEALAAKVPEDAKDMTEAIIAAELLRDRRVVLARLRRMGAQVVEAPVTGMTAGLLNAYITIKRQGLI